MARRTKNQIETTEFLIDFFSMITAAMKQQGITKTVMAKKMGCSVPNITQIMKNTTGCNINAMIGIASAIGVSIKPEYITNKDQLILKIERRETSENNSYAVIKI